MSDAEPILVFDNDDPMYSSGFEMGLLMGRLIYGQEDVIKNYPLRPENAEMIMRICEMTEYSFKADTSVVDDFVMVEFRKT